jgi:hypothetical protein
VIGFLNFASPDGYRPMVTAFRQGLQESGYVEGRNVAIEFRWAEGRSDRLPAHARANVRLVNSSSQSLDSHHRPVAERPVGLVPS